MVLGICAILCSCCFYPVALLLAIIGLILGAIAIKKGPAGKGMAVTGLILSIITVAVVVLLLLFAASLSITKGFSDIF
jgi:energy-converting hydrogenase Eha subunit E